jgi:outer membrane lipoprotein-sorting protein
VNIFRRLPLNRLLLLCALVVAVGVSATALASALGSGPTPPAKPLAQAVHDALSGAGGEQVQGVSASITLTNHLLEGANLASGGGQGGELASSPLITGASGRLWIAKDGRVRLELQAEKGDTQILYDGHTLQLYDAATNTLYRYTPPAAKQPRTPAPADTPAHGHEVPTVAKIEEAISHLSSHANVSGATPTDVAGHAAYTVRVSPNEGGSLIGGAELSFDAANGAPLRAAIYSSTSSSPVIELAATAVSYGPVSDSVFAFTPPPGVKIEEVSSSSAGGAHKAGSSTSEASKPNLTTHGHGLSAIAVLESKTSTAAGKSTGNPLEGLPQVSIDGMKASELRTELGTLLSFERSGVRYLLAGSVTPGAIEELARGL